AARAEGGIERAITVETRQGSIPVVGGCSPGSAGQDNLAVRLEGDAADLLPDTPGEGDDCFAAGAERGVEAAVGVVVDGDQGRARVGVIPVARDENPAVGLHDERGSEAVDPLAEGGGELAVLVETFVLATVGVVAHHGEGIATVPT